MNFSEFQLGWFVDFYVLPLFISFESQIVVFFVLSERAFINFADGKNKTRLT